MLEAVHDICKDCKHREKPLDEIKIDENEALLLADLFKVLGDSTRLKIMLILQTEELGVYEISKAIGMSQSAVSHQLRILKNSRLVKSRKEGKFVYYSHYDEHVNSIISQGAGHINH